MKPILVHIHIYYPDIWKELKECLKNITPHPFDMYVTMVDEYPDIQTDIKNNFPNAKIMIVENRGYDIGPFIHILNQVNLDDYSYVVKLHTKRDVILKIGHLGFRKLDGSKWRDALLSFIKNSETFNLYLQAFEHNPQIGIQANHKVIVYHDFYDKCANTEMKKWLKENNLPYIKYAFVAGTMFIARANIFKDIQKLNFSLYDFPDPKGEHKTQLAHVIERLFDYFVYKNGFIITDSLLSPQNNLKYHRYLYFYYTVIFPLMRFFYQKKITKSGKLRTKICKIPLPTKFFYRSNSHVS